MLTVAPFFFADNVYVHLFFIAFQNMQKYKFHKKSGNYGFFDYLDSGAVLAIEWSENIDAALPQGTIRIHIEPGERGEDRIITAQADTLPPGWKE